MNENYFAQSGDYGFASQSPQQTGGVKNYSQWKGSGSTSGGREISALGGTTHQKTAGWTGMDTANTVMGGIQTIRNLWSAWESNKLAKESFKYNKKMSNKNFALAKDAYDRKARRSNNLDRAQNGESMESIHRDQFQYNERAAAKRKEL